MGEERDINLGPEDLKDEVVLDSEIADPSIKHVMMLWNIKLRLIGNPLRKKWSLMRKKKIMSKG